MSTTSLANATKAISEIVTSRRLTGAKFTDAAVTRELNEAAESSFPTTIMSLTWERGWGCSCSLYIRLREAEYRKQHTWTIEAEISWSSTGHTIQSALCASTLYREVIELAAMIETSWDQFIVAREPRA